MGKETHDQKRKKKLAERRKREVRFASQAYSGSKYRSDDLVPAWMDIDIAIHSAYVVSRERLTDRDLYRAIDSLVTGLKLGNLPPLPDDPAIDYKMGDEEGLVFALIRRTWRDRNGEQKATLEERIGILRTMLGTTENMRSSSPDSQVYVRHVVSFMTHGIGHDVQVVRRPAAPPEVLE